MSRSHSKIEEGANQSLELRLYVSGDSVLSTTATANLRAVCDAIYPSLVKLEIIDVLQEPVRALADGILVTPTLMKVSPLPALRLVGDLSDTRQVELAFGIVRASP